ncbi:amino acid ABC transporter ATP-binding protein [Devosia sp. A369]
MMFIEVENLVKCFGALQVLRGIDFQMDTGEVVAIIGRSGSGKSTLLRCIAGLESVQGGAITVGGIRQENGDWSAEGRRLIGMVFQSYNLFPHLSVEANVTLGLRKVQGYSKADAQEMAMFALTRVGLAEKAKSYPRQLSGGQMQRVAIARALALKSKVLLLDEITSALDPETVGEVLKVLERLVEDGTTMVLVTHEMAFAARAATRLVFMDGGRIVEDGKPREVLDHPKTPQLGEFLKSTRH